MKKRKTVQPNEELPTALPVETVNPTEGAALRALRSVFDELDRLVAGQSRGATPKHHNEERFALRKLRDKVAVIIRELDDARHMPRVPEGGDS